MLPSTNWMGSPASIPNSARGAQQTRHLALWATAILGILNLVTAPASLRAEEPKAPAKDPAAEAGEGRKYLRVRKGDDQTPLALETAVTRFTAKDTSRPLTTVDLVSVVHIGDRAYYDKLNKLFTQYDAVLYELVAAEGARPPAEGQRREGGNHPVTAIQKTLQNMLALDFQLDCVDYTRPNFIHADMTPEEMSKSMSDRNESWMQMFFKMLGQGFARQGTQGPTDLQLVMAFFSKDRPLRLKRIAAQQFDDLDGSLAALGGPDGSTLITERNKKALQVLQRELQAGKRRVAIFYGAGHMSDMAMRLEKEFGLQRTEDKWLTAWSLEPKAEPKAAAQP